MLSMYGKVKNLIINKNIVHQTKSFKVLFLSNKQFLIEVPSILVYALSNNIIWHLQ